MLRVGNADRDLIVGGAIFGQIGARVPGEIAFEVAAQESKKHREMAEVVGRTRRSRFGRSNVGGPLHEGIHLLLCSADGPHVHDGQDTPTHEGCQVPIQRRWRNVRQASRELVGSQPVAWAERLNEAQTNRMHDEIELGHFYRI